MQRFDIFLVQLNPTLGSEINKTRPCVIISPDEMNDHTKTVIVAPMTSTTKSYPTRVNFIFQDKIRLIKKVGVLDRPYQEQLLLILAEMFAF